jgi:hypothetical protein
MASIKKRRKLIKAQRGLQGRPKKPADGDRRRRGGLTADQAVALKLAMREGLVPPDARMG